MGDLGARGRKERNAFKDTIVFSIFHAQILSDWLSDWSELINVNLGLNTYSDWLKSTSRYLSN